MRRRCNKTSSRAPTSDQPGPSRMEAAPAAPPPDHPQRVRAPVQQEPAPACKPTRSHPALKVGGRTPPTVWWFTARTEAAGSRRRMQSLCGPDGPHINRNGHRRTSPRAARTMRARMSHVGPTMVEPHGCGGAATRPQAAPPTSDQPGPSRMEAAPVAQAQQQRHRVRAPPRQQHAPTVHFSTTTIAGLQTNPFPPGIEGRRQDAADRVVVHSENRGGRKPPANAKPSAARTGRT